MDLNSNQKTLDPKKKEEGIASLFSRLNLGLGRLSGGRGGAPNPPSKLTY
jgi:hypothetical protein